VDGMELFNKILDGSPWALLIAACFLFWKLRAEYIHIIDLKTAALSDKDAEIQALHREYKDTFREMSDHIEKLLSNAHKEFNELQEKRLKESMNTQQELHKVLAELDDTICRLTTSMRQSSGE
jgi:mevalonate kinase